MKNLIVILALLPALSVAGKAERDYQPELNGYYTAATAAYKKSCGCELKITMGKGITTKDLMIKTKYMAATIQEGVAKFCTDEGSKKALCTMKSVEFDKGESAKFAFDIAKHHGIATTDGTSTIDFDAITNVLDKD